LSPQDNMPHAPFGTILGYAPGKVPVYSSDYETANEQEYPNRHAYRSYLDGVFMGYKWQCVEFARRWLYLNKGYIFADVPMAYDIFHLTEVTVVSDHSTLPMKSFRNGARRPPEAGCLLIWDEGGEFEVTGHVGIVTEVLPEAIRFVEQNVHHHVWPEGRPYSRELKARVAEDGSYWIQCSFGDDVILGWVIQTDDATHAEHIRPPRRSLFNILLHKSYARPEQRSWLNIANEDESAFVKMMGGHHLMTREHDRNKYMVISATARKELKRATNELHALFMHATDYVLQHPELLPHFNLPSCLWPRIKQSWDNRRNQMITGRFDFCMTENGIKVYEYNADSGSCHMEAGKVQDKWALHMNVDEGESAGDKLHEELMEAWQKSDVKGVLHIMQDTDMEETYHALFMKEAIERAGIECKILRGVHGLHWRHDGAIVDEDGIEVRWVWKTWAWETALDQIREECEQNDDLLKHYEFDRVRDQAPRLVDVLLRKEVMVYEPLWTLIPSNKAIMAVLWQLFPDHPYLLDTQFQLTDALTHKGYAEKPIAGRCGHNISIVDKGEVLHSTAGKFDHQDMIYQELCMLPRIGDYNAQVCTFTVAGSFAGLCMRVDTQAVITKGSDVMPLRVIEDDDLMDEE
jgi:glutathionylspermidine amidase/synthetase